MNHIIITGRITADPELAQTQTGIEVSRFSVAVDRPKVKDAQKETDFFSCVAWRQTGAFISTYFKKGDGIVLSGTMQCRKYKDRNGNDRTAWELIVNNAEFPIPKKSDNHGVTQPEPVGDGLVELGDGDLPF